MSLSLQRLNAANEVTWLQLGTIAEKQGDLDKSVMAYNKALGFNPVNVKALIQLASICRKREQFPKAIEYLQMILSLDSKNGEVWGALGHCNLMMDELRKAYDSYQQALLNLPNPHDPSLWYGIGLMFDRYGCYEQAEGAFISVLKMDANFEKKEDIYFQLGIIYKQQMKLGPALECFNSILDKPPPPLTETDIWFQIGHTHELLQDYKKAREAYQRVLSENDNSPKVLHRLGWLIHKFGTEEEQEEGHEHLVRSIQLDHTDGQAWYLLGRIYMDKNMHRRSYEAFQQAIYRDPNNPLFWCSIGALYHLMNQYQDALHAFIRAIRLSPYLAEGWYNLGILYETCEQFQDALDAYNKANELDAKLGRLEERVKKVTQLVQGGPQENGTNNTDQLRPILPDPAHPTSCRPRQGNSVPDLVLPASLSNSEAFARNQGGPFSKDPAPFVPAKTTPESRPVAHAAAPSIPTASVAPPTTTTTATTTTSPSPTPTPTTPTPASATVSAAVETCSVAASAGGEHMNPKDLEGDTNMSDAAGAGGGEKAHAEEDGDDDDDGDDDGDENENQDDDEEEERDGEDMDEDKMDEREDGADAKDSAPSPAPADGQQSNHSAAGDEGSHPSKDDANDDDANNNNSDNGGDGEKDKADDEDTA